MSAAPGTSELITAGWEGQEASGPRLWRPGAERCSQSGAAASGAGCSPCRRLPSPALLREHCERHVGALPVLLPGPRPEQSGGGGAQAELKPTPSGVCTRLC